MLKENKGKNKSLKNSISIFLLCIVISVAILYLFNIYQWSFAPFYGFGWRTPSGWAVVGRVYEDGYKAGFRIGDRIIEINGKPVKSLASLRNMVNKEIGALNRFIILRDVKKHTVDYYTSRFGLARVAMVFGIPWLIGILIICIGTFIFYTTPSENRKWSFFLFCLCAGLFLIFFNQRTLRPPWVQIFGLIGFCFLPATILHMAFISPFYEEFNPRHSIYTSISYIISFFLFITVNAFSTFFSESPKYLRSSILIYCFLSILIFIAMLFYEYRKLSNRLAKLKIRVVLFGFHIGVLLPLAEPLLNSIFGIFILPNIEMATLPFITVFPLSIAYAIVKHDLFEIDVFMKRTAGYILSTASIALFYLLFVFNVNFFLKTIFIRHQHVVNFLFILAVVFFFNPITNSAQAIVNRFFFRQKYDYKEPVKQLLKDITSIFDLDIIIMRVLNILSNTMFIENIHIFLYNSSKGAYLEYDPDEDMSQQHKQNGPEKKEKKNKLIPTSNSLVKLLTREKKEIQKDSLLNISKFTPFRKNVLLLFNQWNAQLIIPFITHNKLAGFMVLGSMKSGRYYNIDDLEFLKIIANQTAIALENVNLIQDKIEQEKIEEELKIAGVIQRRMLPETAPYIKDFSMYNQIIPSQEIGGDFYDFIEFPSEKEKEMGIIIGDVSGHGISGALLMSAAHSICQNQALYLKDAGAVMREVNRLMIKETKKKAFVALTYARLLPDKRMIISTAGLPPALHYDHQRRVTRFLKNEGERLPLGIIEDLSYAPLRISLNRGDVILFYTDGIIEVLNKDKELFGLHRLKELFSSLIHMEPEKIYNAILSELKNFSGKKAFDDDMTIIILKQVDSFPLDASLSLPISLASEKIILESVESLARLFSFSETEITRIKTGTREIYLFGMQSCKPISDYKLFISLYPDGLNPENSTKDKPDRKTEKDHAKRGEIIGDNYCLELLPKGTMSDNLSSRSSTRLIINFIK